MKNQAGTLGIIGFIVCIILSFYSLSQGSFLSAVCLFFFGPISLAVGFSLYEDSPRAEEERKIELKQKGDEIARFEKLYKIDKFRCSYKLEDTSSNELQIDKLNKLFLYSYKSETGVKHYAMSPLKKIQLCSLEEQIKYKSTAFKQGLKDAAISSITGVGIIRDIDSLQEAYSTGKVEMTIKFINVINLLEERVFVIDDVNRAIEIRNWICSNI